MTLRTLLFYLSFGVVIIFIVALTLFDRMDTTVWIIANASGAAYGFFLAKYLDQYKDK